MRRRQALPALFLALLSSAAACAAAPRADEGFIAVPGGRVWYHRVGDGPGTPLLLLHGGPGSASYGLKPWFALGKDRPVIIYDQLGSGKSDRPADTTLYTVDRYVRELQAVRDSLGLGTVHLYGRSWGAMLAEAYMASNPEGVRSLILSSPLVTTAQWEKDADSLIRTLPDSFQRMIATSSMLPIASPPAKPHIDTARTAQIRSRPHRRSATATHRTARPQVQPMYRAV